MSRMPQLVERGKKDRRLGEPNGASWEAIDGLEVDARVELIRALLPLGLAEVGRMLDEEVERLAGPRHGRKACPETPTFTQSGDTNFYALEVEVSC